MRFRRIWLDAFLRQSVLKDNVPEMVSIKSPREIELMRESGAILAEVLEMIRSEVKPGVRTGLIDEKSEELIRERGGTPLFLHYKGYPASICISINEEVVHGIPGERELREGDVVSVDVGVKHRNYHADAAITVPVGDVSDEAKRLMSTCKAALGEAIRRVRPQVKLREVSAAVQEAVESEGFSVVRKFVGHGIGQALHEEPQIPNFVDGTFNGELVLKPGMVLAIEPMINAGGHEVEVTENGWTVVTRDRSLSAHFEHTVAVSESGADVLTDRRVPREASREKGDSAQYG